MFGLKLVREKELLVLQETVTRLDRTLEDIGWTNLTMPEGDGVLLPEGLRKIVNRCRIYYYNNPLAGHWVNLTTSFVFGEGVSEPKCVDETAQEILSEFWNDPDNKLSVTGFFAQQQLSDKIQTEGNLFIVGYLDEMNTMRCRVFEYGDVLDIVNHPDDKSRSLFYRVRIKEEQYDYINGVYKNVLPQTFYIPSFDNASPESWGVPPNLLVGDARMFHYKINCGPNDKFGVPDLYRGLDWMKAHKDTSGDIATLVKALSKFAWNKKVKGTAAQAASIANNLQAKTDLSQIRNDAGQTYVHNEGVEMEAVDVKTGGVSIGIDSARQSKLMVCAASGIFEHYFGDPSTGNLATAKTMEAPMVRKFARYQRLWTEIYNDLCIFQLIAKTQLGLFSGEVEIDTKQNRIKLLSERDLELDIDFPPVIEEDLKEAAEAYTKAKEGGLMSSELAAQRFMLAANVNNIEEEWEKLSKEIEEKKAEDQAKFEMEQQARMAQPQLPKGKPVATKVKETLTEQLLNEALNPPKKNSGRSSNRLERKNNFLTQRMNFYTRMLGTHFKTFRREVEKNVKVSGENGRYTTKIEGLEGAVETLVFKMKAESRKHFPVAVEIGERYTRAEAREYGIELLDDPVRDADDILEAKGKATGVLEESFAWNDDYLENSLKVDLVAKLTETGAIEAKTEQKAIDAIIKKVIAFESRISMYGGAFWTVEERAVREAGKGTGLMANYAGPLDERNSPGCRNAVINNPYPLESVPVPGSFESGPNCRHAIQIIGPRKSVGPHTGD